MGKKINKKRNDSTFWVIRSTQQVTHKIKKFWGLFCTKPNSGGFHTKQQSYAIVWVVLWVFHFDSTFSVRYTGVSNPPKTGQSFLTQIGIFSTQLFKHPQQHIENNPNWVQNGPTCCLDQFDLTFWVVLCKTPRWFRLVCDPIVFRVGNIREYTPTLLFSVSLPMTFCFLC